PVGVEPFAELLRPARRQRRMHRAGVAEPGPDCRFPRRRQWPPRRGAQAFRGGTAVGAYQSAGAQLDPAVPARDHDHHLVQALAVDRREDRASRSARRFAIVAGAVFRADPVGPAVVGRGGIGDLRHERERGIRGIGRCGLRQEPAVFRFQCERGPRRQRLAHALPSSHPRYPPAMGGGTITAVAGPAVAARVAVAPLVGLAEALADTLPTGSAVVVRWRGPEGEGISESPGAAVALHASAEAGLDGDVAAGDPAHIEEYWNDGELRIALAASLAEPLPASSRAAWVALARRTVAATLDSARAQARIEALQKAQKLQQALYEIADLAGSSLEMEEMLRRIHAVVGGLMYAENFYIVLYDEGSRSIRFLYFADRLDPYVAN